MFGAASGISPGPRNMPGLWSLDVINHQRLGVPDVAQCNQLLGFEPGSLGYGATGYKRTSKPWLICSRSRDREILLNSESALSTVTYSLRRE